MPPRPEKSIRSRRNLIKAIVAAVAVVVAGAAFLFLGGEPKGAAIDMKAPEKTSLGELFEISVVFRNESQSDMKDATISLSLPRGVSFAESEGEARAIREVGDVAPGEEARELFKLTVSEGAEAEKVFKAEADYIPGGVNKHISISKEIKVRIEKPVSASVEFPDKAVSGEEFDWMITLVNNSEGDVKVKVSAEPTGDLTTDFKTFEVTVPVGEEIKKKYKGSAVLPEGESFGVKISVSGTIAGSSYLFDEKTVDSVIAPSPLFLKAELKGKASDYAVTPGERLEYAVTVRNNSDVPLQNVFIRGVVKGEMYDIDSIESRGIIDKSARLVTWDMSTDESLKEIAPNDIRVYDLSISLKNDYDIRRLSDRNFSVELAVRAESPTVPYFVKSLKTVNIASVKSKVSGRLTVDAQGYFRDAASGILNDGDLPPTVGVPTEATVHWVVSSYATDMDGVEIRAELPTSVELTGEKKVDVGEFSFDKEKNEVIWRIPKILATTGVLSKSLEAIFQVKMVPLSAHIGGYMAIMGDTAAYATDGFTGQRITGGDGPVTTQFSDDATVNPNDGIVR